MTMHQKETPFKSEGPQPLLRAIPPGSSYPVQSLGSLAAVVPVVQGMTLAPMAIPAQSALAVASLTVQGFADVEALRRIFAPIALRADHCAIGRTQIILRQALVDGTARI